MDSVLFDSQIFCLQVKGGISRYFAELMARRGDFSDAGWDVATPYRWVMNQHAAALPGNLRRPAYGLFRHTRPLLATSYAASKVRHYSLVHHTYYHPRFLGAFRTRGVISTLHDMIPERYPQLFPGGNPHLAKDEYVAASDALICVSEATRRDVIEHYGMSPDRLVVIPLAAGPIFQPQDIKDPQREAPYFLYVGPRGGYKNFDLLARALAVSESLRDVKIILAGGPDFSAAEVAKLSELGMQDRVVHRHPSDAQLRDLYCGAIALVCPSAYEGFGLPLLEAMSCGCPVIAADRASLPEIAGGAAEMFDPENADELSHLLYVVAADEHRRNGLRAAGLQRAQAFSWERTRSLTSDLYAQVA